MKVCSMFHSDNPNFNIVYDAGENGKSADYNLVPALRAKGSQFPSTVVEVGWSESHPELVKDAKDWLAMSPLVSN